MQGCRGNGNHTHPMGIPIVNPVGNPMGILWESCGNSYGNLVGMGWEWEFKFHSHGNPANM